MRTKMILSTLLIVNTLSFAGGNVVPFVEETVLEAPNFIQSSDFYVGVGLSGLKLKNDFTEESFKAKAILLQAGYNFNNYISVEGRYTRDVGKVEYNHGSDHRVNEGVDIDDYPTNFSNVALYLKPSYAYEKFTAYTLLGYGEVTLTNIPQGDVDRAEAGFQWGVGFAYEINVNISLFIDYVSLYEDKGFDYRAGNEDIKVDTLSMGISYRF